MKRTLSLKAERLTDLSATDLTAVAGAEATGLPCKLTVTGGYVCQPSDYVMSLCGCMTSYCSIDVC